ncbi:hypothetical protein SNEBB_003393 [Seison nebaliae]|nr:hypothetical protein SNEBB_003393 [Seison nebaliae]
METTDNDQVLIERSNGISHDALIIAINIEERVVHVEWVEADHIKGKSLSFDSILRLNPAFDEKRLTFIHKRLNEDKLKDIDCSISSENSNHERKSNFKQMENSAMEIPCTKGYVSEKLNDENQENIFDEIVPSDDDDLIPSNPLACMIMNWRKMNVFQLISSNDNFNLDRIIVCTRKRPLYIGNKKKIKQTTTDCITVTSKDQVVVHQEKHKVDTTKYLDHHRFRFSYAFDENSDNYLVFRFTAYPLIQNVFDGRMGLCFAYGQTGSGKTYTMSGTCNELNGIPGIYSLTTNEFFKKCRHVYENKFRIFVSFFEIYCGRVHDLLNDKKKLKILEDSKNMVNVIDLTEKEAISEQQVMKFVMDGMNIRTSGQTSANDNSSRSHAVFQIILKHKIGKRFHSKFSLIDLAGSERGKDTNISDNLTKNEGKEINQSLFALKECIRALNREDNRIPFRGSTLTQILKDSFIQKDSRICTIATISPGYSDVEHTLNTLHYANRLKELNTNSDTRKNHITQKPNDRKSSETRNDLVHNNIRSSSINPDKQRNLLIQAKNEFQLASNNLTKKTENLFKLFDNVNMSESDSKLEREILDGIKNVTSSMDMLNRVLRQQQNSSKFHSSTANSFRFRSRQRNEFI